MLEMLFIVVYNDITVNMISIYNRTFSTSTARNILLLDIVSPVRVSKVTPN